MTRASWFIFVRLFFVSLILSLLFFQVQVSSSPIENDLQKIKEVTVDSTGFTIYFFWGEECELCKDEKAFLENIKNKYPGIVVEDFEIYNSDYNKELLLKMLKEYNNRFSGLPVIFVGDEVFTGSSDEVKSEQEEAINSYYLSGNYQDPMTRLKSPDESIEQIPNKENGTGNESQIVETSDKPNGESEGNKSNNEIDLNKSEDGPISIPKQQPDDISVVKGSEENQVSDNTQTGIRKETINVPLLGKVEANKISILLVTFIIAGIDSLNPCAFFVLFSLMGLLIHAGSRRKIIFIGGIFVLISGIIYFLFMAAWLNLFLLLKNKELIMMIAGAVAIIIASINIKDFFLFKQGISLTVSENAKHKLFGRMRKLTRSASMISIIIGTIVLAIAANSYELLCTAGFPMIYTNILSYNNLLSYKYYIYIALYNLIYIIPLAAIVCISANIFGKRNITEWQGRVLKLVSGAMMLGLGIILFFKSALLNNIIISSLILICAVAGSLLIALFFKNRLN